MNTARRFTILALAAASALTVFVSTANAGTVLCKTHEDPCKAANVVSSLHLENSEPFYLLLTDVINLAALLNVLCLKSLLKGSLLGESGAVDLEALSFSNCGSSAAHNNCVVTIEINPTLSLERTALNLGAAKLTGAQIRIKCTELGFIKIDCVYSLSSELTLEGALHKEGVGHGMLKATSTSLKAAGGGACPQTSTVDTYLLEPLEHVYVVSKVS